MASDTGGLFLSLHFCKVWIEGGIPSSTDLLPLSGLTCSLDFWFVFSGEQNERPKKWGLYFQGPREGNPSSHRDADGG
jgi:hypothetical protein